MGKLDLDKEFELLLFEKKHKEVISKLNEVLKVFSNIEKNISNIEIPKTDVSNIEKILKQIELKSNTDKSVPNSIKNIGEVISNKLEELKEKQVKKEYIFNIERNSSGLINVVKVNVK